MEAANITAEIINATISSIINSTDSSASASTSTSTIAPVTTAATPTVSHYSPHLKFASDGSREPPTFVTQNNVVIMVLGLSILILPIVGFLVMMVARSRLFKDLRDMKFLSSHSEEGGSGLPYSQFDSEPDFEQVPARKGNKDKDVRVLITNDNALIGGSRSGITQPLTDDIVATIEVTPTFVVPHSQDSQGSSHASHAYT